MRRSDTSRSRRTRLVISVAYAASSHRVSLSPRGPGKPTPFATAESPQWYSEHGRGVAAGWASDGRTVYEPLGTDLAKPVVVLVEDEADLVAMAGAYLRRDGFQVVTASDTRRPPRRCASTTPT